MRKLLALWRRELIEHRGAFLWAPAIILGLFILTVGSVLGRARFEIPPEALLLPLRRLYEDALLVGFVLWWLYFAAALFFYLADAFSADRRNNAMLFWKSLPVSDFGMLLSKLSFGMVAVVALGTLFTAATGIVLGILALIVQWIVPTFTPPPVGEVVQSFVSLVTLAAGYFVLSVLWYAPFIAWVGALSTVVRRWSIPLAFFIPGAISLIEVTVFRTHYVGSYFDGRLRFGLDWTVLLGMFYTLVPISGTDVLAIVLLGVDWIQFAGGIVVAAALVYAASLYRRRGIAG